MSKVMNEYVIKQVATNEVPEEVPDEDDREESNCKNIDTEDQNDTENEGDEKPDAAINCASNEEPEIENRTLQPSCSKEAQILCADAEKSKVESKEENIMTK